MFLRRNRKKHKGEDYDYWTLVKSVHTSRGPRQRTVATLGRPPERYSRAAYLFDDEIREAATPAAPDKKRLTVIVTRKNEPEEWAAVRRRDATGSGRIASSILSTRKLAAFLSVVSDQIVWRDLVGRDEFVVPLLDDPDLVLDPPKLEKRDQIVFDELGRDRST